MRVSVCSLAWVVLAGLALWGVASAQDGPPLTRIAFGSCADQEKPQPIWDAVLGYKPDLFIFAGDNVYGDLRNGREVPEPERMASLREAYATAAQIPGFREVRRTIPHLAIWDDHDYGQNDAGAEFASNGRRRRCFSISGAPLLPMPAAPERACMTLGRSGHPACGCR